MKPARLSEIRSSIRENPNLRQSAGTLLISNALPLLGVLFFRWDLFTIMFLFWIENVFLGIINVPKMLLAQGQANVTGPMPTNVRSFVITPVLNVFVTAFFMVHYGMFTAIHGVFVFVLFGGNSMRPSSMGPSLDAVLPHVQRMWVPVAAIIASHLVSFFVNYIGQEEYRRVSVQQQMAVPYGRIVVLHLVIIFGGIAIQLLGAPWAAIALLVVLKTALDLAAHVGERKRAQNLKNPESAS